MDTRSIQRELDFVKKRAHTDHELGLYWKERAEKLEPEVRALRALNAELVGACEALLTAGESGMMVSWYQARERACAVLTKANAPS